MTSRLSLPVLATAALLLASCASNTSPVVPGAKPRDHGAIGAGEGPAYKGGKIYFTDGKGINQLELATGKASVFRTNCGSPNGLMFDRSGRLIMCESKGRRISMVEGKEPMTFAFGAGPHGECVGYTNIMGDTRTRVLTAGHGGHRYNSPNDLTMDSQNRIYFTDPRYGPRETMEMRDGNGRLVEGVYRIDRYLIDRPTVTRILGPDDVERPNGILVSHGDKYLYVADNNNNTHGGSRKLLRFDLNKDGTVKPGSRKVIFDWKGGRGPDGVKMDAAGRLYVAAGVNKANDYETDEFKAGCYILKPNGGLLDFVPTAPDEATNCALRGKDRKTLFITSGGHLWSVALR